MEVIVNRIHQSESNVFFYLPRLESGLAVASAGEAVSGHGGGPPCEKGLAADRALAAGSVAVICSCGLTYVGCDGGIWLWLWSAASGLATPVGADTFPAEVGHGSTFSAARGRSKLVGEILGAQGPLGHMLLHTRSMG
jgi:hypothetical protein